MGTALSFLIILVMTSMAMSESWRWSLFVVQVADGDDPDLPRRIFWSLIVFGPLCASGRRKCNPVCGR